MARQTNISTLAVDIQANAIAELLDDGYIDILTGPQPKSADDPIEQQRVLATLRFSSPAFQASFDGKIVAFSIRSGVGVADGDPRWFRAYQADHSTAIFDGSAGRGNDNNMDLPAKTISEGVTVGCSTLSHTVRKSTSGI